MKLATVVKVAAVGYGTFVVVAACLVSAIEGYRTIKGRR